MTEPRPQDNPEELNSAESEVAERTREIHTALNSITSTVTKWFAVTVLATTRESFQTPWPIAQSIGRALGVDESEFARGDGKNVKEYCEKSLATSGIIESQTAPGYRGAMTTGFRLTPNMGMTAAAVAGVLFKTQLDHPGIDLPYVFGGNAERRDLGDMVRLRVLSMIAEQSIDDYIPASFIWAVGTPHDYKTIDTLANMGVLDRVTKEDRKMRSFVISKPQSYAPTAVAPERLTIYRASMDLLGESREVRVTGAQLMDRVMAMFPDASEEAVWKNLTGKHPVFLKSELHPALRRPYDKVAVRINVRYRDMLTQLMDDLANLAQDEANRESARKYAQNVMKSSTAMGILWELFYSPVFEGPSIPAPDYEGWRADRHKPEPWKPQFPALQRAKIDLGDMALRDPKPDTSGRVPLTNNLLSEMIERAAQARRGKSAS